MWPIFETDFLAIFVIFKFLNFHLSTHQIGAAPARHLCVAAEFLERMVNMGIKAIKDHLTTMITMVNMVKMITMVNMGIKDHLVTMGSAGNKVPLSTCFFKI